MGHTFCEGHPIFFFILDRIKVQLGDMEMALVMVLCIPLTCTVWDCTSQVIASTDRLHQKLTQRYLGADL